MDSLSKKKVDEGNQLLADAAKAMKTSLFKRKPDLDTAADAYSKAGTCFKTAKDFQNAIQAFQNAAQCYEQNNSFFSAAKQYEQVGIIANEIKSFSLVYNSFFKSAELMILNGTRDSAGILLERGASMLKTTDPESSLKLVKRAIQVAEVEDKNHQIVTMYENAVNLALKIEQYTEAIELVDNSLELLEKIGTSEQIIRYILTVCLIHLSKDDWVSAKNYLEKMKQRFSLSCRADELLEIYEEKDDEKFKNLIKNYLGYAVDNEALKIANRIIKSKEWISSIQEHNAPENKNSIQKNSSHVNEVKELDEEEFADGLL
ncbi:gamma-soluble NSF attachment -like [Brachionus plicatilis]|uniref:Gamma-soluble NSF attachment protein n=1 Tax=Brachionus plicatilis TaxID=10195 RepID=A0A3M7RGQ1_BRAPC|nr:gamma-soluble NSF attachment -like [Brachionus plicatilis]